MTIDTRGPARRRETVRDKNANGKSTEKDQTHKRRTEDDASDSTDAGRRTTAGPGRNHGMLIGGASCETTAVHEVYRT